MISMTLLIIMLHPPADPTAPTPHRLLIASDKTIQSGIWHHGRRNVARGRIFSCEYISFVILRTCTIDKGITHVCIHTVTQLLTQQSGFSVNN